MPLVLSGVFFLVVYPSGHLVMNVEIMNLALRQKCYSATFCPL